MDGSSLPPPPIAPTRPDEALQDPGRSPTRGIVIGVGIALLAVIVIATAVVLTSDGDGLPESVDGLDRIHSREAEAFEENLDEFALAGITITGAMYGEEDGPPLLLVERIEAGDGEAAAIPLRATFDGAVVGFESSGAGEVDEDASVEGDRAGFEVMCASVEVVADPSIPGGVATMCGWKGRVIGVVFDFRTSDTTTALDTTGRIAQEVEAA
jgi:hypothetical protein